jgi:hypothetical protein
MCFSGGSAPAVPNETGYSGSSNNIGNSASTAATNLQNYTQAGSAAQNAQTGLAQGQLNAAGSSNLAAGAAGANNYTNSVLPAAQSNIAQSQAWGSQQGVNQAQANAAASTGQAYNAARMNNMQQLGSYGVDPSQMKSGALNLNANLQQAGAVGNAAYTAGQNRQLQGINLTNQAANTGLNASAAGAAYGNAGAGQLATSTQLGNQSLATTTQSQLAPSQYMGTALAGYGGAANIATQGYQNALAGAQYSNQVNGAEAGGIGEGVGAIGGLVADAYSGADGGVQTGRGFRSAIPGRFDNGGMPDDTSVPDDDSSNIPGQGAMGTAGPQTSTMGGTSQAVGLSPQQLSQQADQDVVQGVAKGFGATYKANGGAIPARRYDNGGGINVPSITISGAPSPTIMRGGANQGQVNDKKGGSSSGIGGLLGGVSAMGPNSAMGKGVSKATNGGTTNQGIQTANTNMMVSNSPPGGYSSMSGFDSNGNPIAQGSPPAYGSLTAGQQQAGSAVQGFNSNGQAIDPNAIGSGASAADAGSSAANAADSAAAVDLGDAGFGAADAAGGAGDAAGDVADFFGGADGGVQTGRGFRPTRFDDGGSARGPDHSDPNTQRKRYDYGNPAVQHNQQPMAPPLVNIPGPWVGANGGRPQQPTFSGGGSVPGTFISQGASDGTGIDDQVPAHVSVGEYVIPADVVHAKGKEFFDKLVQRYHVPAHQQRQQMGISPQQHGIPGRMR